LGSFTSYSHIENKKNVRLHVGMHKVKNVNALVRVQTTVHKVRGMVGLLMSETFAKRWNSIELACGLLVKK
jgi:hypothetical protein